MSEKTNVQVVKDFFAAVGRGDEQGLLDLCAADIEWIIPGKDWPLAGTHRGHAGVAHLLKTESQTMETTSPEAAEYVAEGDRVMVIGVAKGKVKATNKPFEDHWVFSMRVRDGKVTHIREYIDTQELAEAASSD